jgi:hypothetical protein
MRAADMTPRAGVVVADLEYPYSARIPADIDRPDQVVAGLTFRQVAIIAGSGGICWAAFTAVHSAIPRLPAVAVAAPLVLVLLIAGSVALGSRDGISADRFLLAGLAYLRRPRRLISAPNGSTFMPLPSFLPIAWRKAAGRNPAPLELPAHGVDEAGVLGLAEHGVAGIAACSTVNFSLRSVGEQNALVACFGRFLNALSGPTQILVRTRRIDLKPLVDDLERAAGGLAHPALEAAAREHAAFLADLSDRQQLLGRQALLTVREPATGRTERNGTAGEAGTRIGRRLSEASAALAGAPITVAAYTAAGTADLLADAWSGRIPHSLEGDA